MQGNIFGQKWRPLVPGQGTNAGEKLTATTALRENQRKREREIERWVRGARSVK
ncbi:hypothetical protein GBA52_024841 [Prunus armeniaca]|nr:hypothetical protein GBA52_024841 [Prunus armeniaca]